MSSPLINPTSSLLIEPTRILAVCSVRDIRFDDWFVSDLLALQKLFSTVNIVEQRWLSNVSVDQSISALERILIGHPPTERIELRPPSDDFHLPQLEVVDSGHLLETFKVGLVDMAKRTSLQSERFLVIIIGHGDIYQDVQGIDKTALSIGQSTSSTLPPPGASLKSDFSYLTSDDFVTSVAHAKGRVTLLTTACFLGLWSNPSQYSLYASAKDDKSLALPIWKSGRARGTAFVYSLMDNVLAEYGAALPMPQSWSDDERPPEGPGRSYSAGQPHRIQVHTFTQRRQIIIDNMPKLVYGGTAQIDQKIGDESSLTGIPISSTPLLLKFTPPNPFSNNETSTDDAATSRRGSLDDLLTYWHHNKAPNTKPSHGAIIKLAMEYAKGRLDQAETDALEECLRTRRLLNNRANLAVRILLSKKLTSLDITVEKWLETPEASREGYQFGKHYPSLVRWLVDENPVIPYTVYRKPLNFVYLAVSSGGGDLSERLAILLEIVTKFSSSIFPAGPTTTLRADDFCPG